MRRTLRAGDMPKLTYASRKSMLNRMVQRTRPDLDAVFHALADPTRRAMVETLSRGVASIGEMAEPHDMSFSAASKHVRVLERAGIVRRTVSGRRHVCTLNVRPLASADTWLRHYERFWNERLDALEMVLRDRPK